MLPAAGKKTRQVQCFDKPTKKEAISAVKALVYELKTEGGVESKAPGGFEAAVGSSRSSSRAVTSVAHRA